MSDNPQAASRLEAALGGSTVPYIVYSPMLLAGDPDRKHDALKDATAVAIDGEPFDLRAASIFLTSIRALIDGVIQALAVFTPEHATIAAMLAMEVDGQQEAVRAYTDHGRFLLLEPDEALPNAFLAQITAS